MNDDRTDLEVFQQCRDLVFGDWTSAAIFVPLRVRIGEKLLHHPLRCYLRAVLATAVRYVAIARRDAGYSDPPSLVDGAPDIVAVDGCDRPVCPALRQAALRLFGFIITAVAQTQEPTNLGVGSSNLSGRAKWINNLRQFSV